MVRLGTPTNLKEYMCLNFRTSEKIQEYSIFPIWKDEHFMYFEKSEKLFDCIVDIIMERRLR